MSIELVEASAVKSGRGGKSKGEKYGKYAVAIQKHIPWITEQITKTKDKRIICKNEDIRKEMGGEFVKKNDTSVYWALKYILFQEGIVVESGTHVSGSKLLLMRFATDKDILPESLSKYLEKDDEDEDSSSPEDISVSENTEDQENQER